MSTTLNDALDTIARMPVPEEPAFGPEATRTRQAPTNMFDKAIALKVDMGCLGNKRKVGSDKVTVDADKDRITASKAILASKELEAIRSAQSAVGAQIRALCLPSFFKSGIYLLPIASIATADKVLVDAEAEIMQKLVPAFMEVYPQLVEGDKISLRSTFNAGDYPTASKVRASFYFDWSYISFGVPDALQRVDSDLFMREQEKAAARLNEATEQIQQVLRAQMLDLVEHLSERLSGDRGNGKPKIFRDTVVTNVKEFLATFKNRNITDDSQLDSLCDKANQLLDGVDPDALRESDVTRDRVRAGFEDIKSQLDNMLVNKPTRMIQFAPEEGE